MSEIVRKLEHNGKKIILIGTNHIAEESVVLVQQIIETENPDTVCVELDEKRAEKYLDPVKWASMDIIKVIKENRLVVLFTNIIYAAYQRKLAKEVGTKAGGEMLQAMQSAEKINAKIELIDRDAQVTFKRMWRSLTWIKKIKVFAAFFSEFEGKEEKELQDMLSSESFDTVFSNIQDKFPTVYKDMISDRDKYMATKLDGASGKRIVAVVGRAHLDGISNNLGIHSDIKSLESIPPKRLSSRLLEWLFPVIIIILLGFSFVSGASVGASQLLKWFLWNGGMAALFTAFAFGHPLTILVSFICAPIGALSPVLSVGVFSAIAEATLRKPVVHDFLTVQDDLTSKSSFLKNKLLRIFLVFIFANVGGGLGNIIGGLDMLKNILG